MPNAITQYMKEVSRCALCHGENAIHVPSCQVATGPNPPKIFILGEQPDRNSTLLTGMNGIDSEDPAVVRMVDFMKQAGIDRNDVFYATSVLCVPKDGSRRGPRPAMNETKNCTKHLEKLFTILQPKLIVPLGHTSIMTLQWIFTNWTELRQYILNYDVGTVLERHGMAVYPLYHTSEGTLKVRSERRQLNDWKRIPQIVTSLNAAV